MTDKQPEALKVADWLEIHSNGPVDNKRWAAALLRTQHAEIERLNAAATDSNLILERAQATNLEMLAEIERLNACLKWEQNRAERIGTHGPGCEKWGSAHFECALRAIERKDALLRQCLKHVASNISMTSDGTEAEELYDAIQQELSQ